MSAVKIHIRNFKKWQKPTEGRREWFALDASFFYDRKVREARQLCDDSPDCFIALWREADSNGDITMTVQALKSYWRQILCIESNRFDPLKRLEALSNAGLITFQLLSNDVLNAVQCDSNSRLSESKRVLEQAETPAPVSKNKQDKQTNKETTTPLPPAKPDGRSSGRFFKIHLRGEDLTEEEWIHRCILELRRSLNKSTMGCDSLESTLGLYSGHRELWKRWATLPMEVRMAAFVYTALHSKAENQFTYALTAAEDGQGWEKMPEYIRRAKEIVESGDYEVKING